MKTVAFSERRRRNLHEWNSLKSGKWGKGGEKETLSPLCFPVGRSVGRCRFAFAVNGESVSSRGRPSIWMAESGDKIEGGGEKESFPTPRRRCRTSNNFPRNGSLWLLLAILRRSISFKIFRPFRFAFTTCLSNTLSAAQIKHKLRTPTNDWLTDNACQKKEQGIKMEWSARGV